MTKTVIPAWAVLPKDEKPKKDNLDVYFSRQCARNCKDKYNKIVKAKIVIE